jgi:hypothetical protein
MRRALLLIVCCLVLSLVIQNSCPFGAAGKSSVAPECGQNCPLMRQCSSAPIGQTAWTPDKTPNHFPLFLFTAMKPGHSFRADMLAGEPPFPSIHYIQAFPNQLLKPPNA